MAPRSTVQMLPGFGWLAASILVQNGEEIDLLAALQNLIQNEATCTEAIEIIRSLVDQVVFQPTPDDGLEVELVGEIAKMVHLAQNSNESSPISGAVHEEFVRSVKVVAGVGFEPTTFRL